MDYKHETFTLLHPTHFTHVAWCLYHQNKISGLVRSGMYVHL